MTSLCSFSVLSVKLLGGAVGVLHLFNHNGRVIIIVGLLNSDHKKTAFI